MAARGRTVTRTVGVAAAAIALAAAVPTAWASSGSRPFPPPTHMPPGLSVTTTLNNHTPCRLQLGGGRIWAGQLSQYPPSVIEPGASGSWKITGFSAYVNPDASLSLFYTAANCAVAGEGEGYFMGNTLADGFTYTAPVCGWSTDKLRHSFTSQNAYNATLTIDVSVQTGIATPAPRHPYAGTCTLPIEYQS